MNRIIFTDIDGVLNPHWKKQWSKKAISIYNRICDDFRLQPVITSTWRTNHTISQLQNIFNEQGIRQTILSYTPILKEDRGLEIAMWLKQNNYDDYVVIDDSIRDILPYVKNVVACKSWIGLDDNSYEQIKKIFSK